MPDIIQLLPDSVANQIAAGEVIQRPASAVKELLENAVDAGATEITLVVKDAGKTLIQVIDNGCGMSETDARMSFERHATSKIKKADDLFNIRTKGFRGEALASIAAIAQVELKSRQHDSDTGTQIIIEGSQLKSQGACSCPVGTSFSIKNLFFNVPARRNFLKSEPVELRHIIDEFQRVALPHPGIVFSMHHNGQEVFHLEKGALRQRIVGVFGANYNNRLVPVEEATPIITIKGFVGKPEFARKTRGEQFFFINQRFIKSPYLNHAIQSAYEQILPADSFPSYFLDLEVDPKSIDINIHPTKTEIKFEDEKSIYAILRSVVKKSLGQYNIAPTIDFNQEMSLVDIPLKSNKTILEQPTIKVNPDFNPFKTEKKSASPIESSNKENWEKLFIPSDSEEEVTQEKIVHPDWEKTNEESKRSTFQLHNRYIFSPIRSGFMIIEQQGAHERILYERCIASMEKHRSASQQLLFPKTIELPAADFALVKELLDDINALGFDMSEMGRNTFGVQGIPVEAGNADAGILLEKLMESYKQNLSELKLEKRDNLARSMARNMSIKNGKPLGTQEMNSLIDELFACSMPYTAPDGRPVVSTFTLEDLEKRFKK